MGKTLEFTIPFDLSIDEYLKSEKNIYSYRILSRSFDGRPLKKGGKPTFFYRIELGPFCSKAKGLEKISEELCEKIGTVTVIGAGPAGLFCALRLLERGVKVIVIERGGKAADRMRPIARFWRKGILDPNNNVCFGEGGAGLFSDGKLITRVKSPYVPWVLSSFVSLGGKEEILYRKDPHLGTNKLRKIIEGMGERIRNLGGEIRYHQVVESFEYKEDQIKKISLQSGEKIEVQNLVIAAGHSADLLYKQLDKIGAKLEPKPFSVGVRVEHPRSVINKLQYRNYFDDPKLESAFYRLSYYDRIKNRGSFSFCMCPGGYVLSVGTTQEGLVTNGMSNSQRNSPWSNSAIVTEVKPGEDFDVKDIFSGLNYIRKIEKRAKEVSREKSTGFSLPAQPLVDFLEDKERGILHKNSSPSQLFYCPIKKILPEEITKRLKKSFFEFEKKWPGFISDKATLIAPETRTSAPIRILRGKDGKNPEFTNLFPCGEGAGYAGGITSSAADGALVAELIIASLQ